MRTKGPSRELVTRFHSLFDSSPQALTLHDLDGNIIEVNPAWTNLTGYTEEEVLSQELSSTLRKEELRLATEIAKQLAKGSSVGLTQRLRLRHKDGSAVFVEVSGVAVCHRGQPAAVLIAYHPLQQ